MSDENGNGKGSRLGRAWAFAKRHPYVTATTAVGTAWFAGAELLAAAIVGGVVAKMFGGGGRHEEQQPPPPSK